MESHGYEAMRPLPAVRPRVDAVFAANDPATEGGGGKEAANLLFDQIGPHPSGSFRRVIVPPHLIVRSSCGAAGAV
jgi:DNA-binding LacI/PurR family transcriptional regulator